MKIRCFEELDCWQKARRLTQSVYAYTKLSKFSKDFNVVNQICRAAISIMNNISEGFDAQSSREFIRFLTYSRRSCSETQNCLYIAMDQDYISSEQFQQTYCHCAKIRKMIDGPIRYLRQHDSNKNNPTNRLKQSTGQPANRPNRPAGQPEP